MLLIDPEKETQILSVKLQKKDSYPSSLTCLGAQKNHLIEAVLLSIHYICFG